MPSPRTPISREAFGTPEVGKQAKGPPLPGEGTVTCKLRK